MIIPIDDNTVAVESAADLQSVVSVNTSITNVHFANDINLATGITIDPSRTVLVLDGEYPIGSGIIHTFTDMYSTATADTLGVRAVSSIHITLRNMIISGRNWYGVPYITDSYNTSQVTITYQNLSYTGRQMTYNIYGLTRYIDCDITIENITSSWTGEEVGEINRVEIGGKTVITKSNQNDAMFYYRGNSGTGYLKILADADVTVSSNYYFMYTDIGTIPFSIEPGAKLRMTTNTGLSYGSGHRFAPFIVGNNASFEYYQTSSATSIYIPGTLTVGEGASFFMRADYSNSTPLINFLSSGADQNLVLNNPKSFVLYKMGTPAVTFSTSRPFSLYGGQVNYWQNAATFPDAGTFNNTPLYQWHNADWNEFSITGNVGSSMTGVASTLVPPIEPALSNLQLQNARVLAVGKLPLRVNQIMSNDTSISGTTDPNANIKIEYTDESGDHAITDTAGADGSFSTSIPATLPADTIVKVSSNVPFLFTFVTATVQEAGELSIIDAPKRIEFTTPTLSQNPLVLRRIENDPVIVSDTRSIRSQWQLLATVSGPMRSDAGHTIPDGVIFVPIRSTYSDYEPLSEITPILVYTGGPVQTITRVSWEYDMGILLHITNPIFLGEEYKVNVTWSVIPI